jgi:hypothetical protein
MLIICNGAFKSGSTWVHALVDVILEVRSVPMTDIPEKYNLGKSPVSKITESMLFEFCNNENIVEKNYLTKAHFFQVDTLSREYSENVKFIFVERDLRDAIVSHFHHLKVYRNLKCSFSTYYRFLGRYKAYEIWLFNQRCKKYFGGENLFNYADMKADIGAAMDRLCTIIGAESLNPEERQSVVDRTSLDAMRKQAAGGDQRFYHGAGDKNSKLFRKGEVGEYKEYFDAVSLKDIDKIESGHFSALSRLVYAVLFTMRRSMK